MYSQDEQPAGLLGQSQQDEQTHDEVQQEQQHVRQPPVTKTQKRDKQTVCKEELLFLFNSTAFTYMLFLFSSKVLMEYFF